jgi:large subunit ribosomal protein L4
VVDPIELPEVKTKFVAQVYSKWKAPTDSIYLVEKIDENLRRASGNAANVQVIDVETLNVYDCLRARKIFVTKGALTKLSERISKYVGAPQS